MNAFTALVSIVLSGALGFEAQTGYEPALLGRGKFSQSTFLPYGNCYLNNGGFLKIGFSFADAWSVRGTFAISGSYYPQGPAVIDIPDLDEPYEYTDMNSLEFSAGTEVAHSLRFRSGKGDVFAGVEGIWGRFDYASLCTYTEDSYQYDYGTVSYSCKGSGVQGWAGISYPVARFGRFAVNFSTVLKGGGIVLRPYDMPEQYTWKGYYIQPTSNAPLPRWGIAIGLSLAYDSRVINDSSKLLDARLKPDPGRSACCCLFAAGNGASKPGAKADLSGKILQGASAFLAGPCLGSAIGLIGSVWVSVDDFSPGEEVVPLSLGCYLWAPVGSVLGTMWTGNYFNPGGDWKYTILGAWLGNLANLALAEGFILATGGSPWRWASDGSPYNTKDPPPGTYEMIAASSILPAAGAIIGYNLSIKQAWETFPDTLGLRPSWTEHALEQSRETGLKSNTAVISFDIIDLSF